MERKPTCPHCNNLRGIGDFYCYADLANGMEQTHICRVCLYQHLTKYYPGSPAHLAVGDSLTEEERKEIERCHKKDKNE